MIKVGLTGGIGSGKSTVAKIFEVIGIPVFYADNETKNIINYDKNIISLIKENFGEIYTLQNIIDKKKLADIIFKNPEKLEIINSIVHPAVRKKFINWSNKQKSKYTLMEAAILFESGTYKILDKTITVFADQKTRIKRVCSRDNIPAEKVIDRIKNQMSDHEKIKLADFVINNNEKDMIIAQVLKIHGQIKS